MHNVNTKIFLIKHNILTLEGVQEEMNMIWININNSRLYTHSMKGTICLHPFLLILISLLKEFSMSCTVNIVLHFFKLYVIEEVVKILPLLLQIY